MADSIPRRPRVQSREALADVLIASAELMPSDATASRRALQGSAIADRDLWGYYDTLGEYGGFVDWMARAMSRVRLAATEQMPGGDEPAPIAAGPAADLMDAFYGGTDGQAEFMASITPHLFGPGECWAAAERFDTTIPLHLATWSVQSRETFRVSPSGGYEIEEHQGAWRKLLPDSIPVRIWIPHPRWPYMARSPALAALPIMRRIELIEKRILAEMLSRLAMNGILWIPSEANIPTQQGQSGGATNWIRYLIQAAAANIQNPGSASAAIPLPVRMPRDFIKDIRHDKFIDPMDEHLLAELDKELMRLAQALPLSAERQAGFKDANHWNGFIVNEDDIKISIGPVAELVARAVTTGWLQPMLAAAGQPLVGPNGRKIMAWPDYSELVVKPDNKDGFKDLYDRGEVSGTAYRREAGAGEADLPTPDEQRTMILLKAVRDPATFAQAYELLTGEAPPQAPVAGPAPVGPTVMPESGTPPSASDAAVSGPATGAPTPEAPPATVASGLIELRHRRAS